MMLKFFTTTPNATIDEALSVSINTIVHQGEPNGKYFTLMYPDSILYLVL